jgi:hypothetical protein
MRGAAKIQVTPEKAASLFGVPPDAVLVYAATTSDGGMVVTFVHPDLPKVIDGCEPNSVRLPGGSE